MNQHQAAAQHQFNRDRALQIAKCRELVASRTERESDRDKIARLENENAALRSQIESLLGAS